MHVRIVILCIFIALSTILGCTPANKEDLCVQAIFEAKQANLALPLASKCYSEIQSEDDAYASQEKLVAKLLNSERIYGFKAAVTSTTAQQRVGATGPMVGVLFESGMYVNGSVIDPANFVRPLIEVELGYRINTTLTDSVELLDLDKLIAEIVPVIEIPDIGYQDFSEIFPNDIIAANAGSAGYILGAPISLGSIDPNEIVISLLKEGEELNAALATDALGNQWLALHWMINKIISQGYTIQPDHILITGALGSIPPLEPGSYEAHFEYLGEPIQFEVISN